MANRPSGGNNKPSNNKPSSSKPSSSKPSSSKPSSSKPSSSKPSSSKPSSSGGSKPNVGPNGQTAQPKHGVKAQKAAANNYQSALNIRNFADSQHSAGSQINKQGIASAYAGGLSPEQQRYLYDYAGNKGYNIGDDFKEQYKDAAAYNATPDLQKAYNRGSFRGAMADGMITNKEIKYRAKEKAKEKGDGYNKTNGFLKIADKWSQKGGALSLGALNQYGKAYNESMSSIDRLMYSTNGPNGSMPGGDFGLARDALGKTDPGRGSRGQLYNQYLNIKDKKNYVKGDAFSRMANGELTARPRVADTTYLGNIAKNPILGGIAKAPDSTATDPALTPDGNDGATAPTLPEEETNKPSIEGGIGTSGYSNALGIRGRKSSWKSSGRSTGGTSNLGFNRVLANGYFGSR
jgi:hypothetical protein